MNGARMHREETITPMAEAAAPAAPSADAAPAAPDAPSPGTGVPESAPGQVDNQQRLAKPLRPIPNLPGVFPDDDPFPSSRSATTSDSDRPSIPGPTRGPDGRFVASPSSATDGAGDHTLEAADQPTPAPFEIAGEKFASREAFEQNFKSLKGQFKPIQSLAKSLGGLDQVIPQFQRAAESARGWKAEAERLQAELARGGQPAVHTPAATTTPQESPDAAASDIDWGLYAEVKRIATEAGEPHKADQWLIEQTRKSERAYYEKLLADRLAPFESEQQSAAAMSETAALFDNLAGYANPDGSPAFPELSDEAAAYEVGRIWAQLGFNPQDALTPRGAVAAVGVYRMYKANASRSQAGAAPGALPVAPPSPPADARSAAALSEGRPPTALSVPDGSQPSADAARILAALRTANSGNRSVLGFDA